MGCHYSGSHLNLHCWHMCLETLLPLQRNSDANTFHTTDADAGHHSTTSNRSPSNACTGTEASHQQPGVQSNNTIPINITIT
jgi:hypothetical protein